MDQNTFSTEALHLIGAALAMQKATSTAASITPIPMTDRFVVIGTPAEVARLLGIAPASADNPSTAGAVKGGVTDFERTCVAELCNRIVAAKEEPIAISVDAAIVILRLSSRSSSQSLGGADTRTGTRRTGRGARRRPRRSRYNERHGRAKNIFHFA